MNTSSEIPGQSIWSPRWLPRWLTGRGCLQRWDAVQRWGGSGPGWGTVWHSEILSHYSNSMQFNTQELFISGVFHLIYVGRGWPWVPETVQSVPVGKGGATVLSSLPSTLSCFCRSMCLSTVFINLDPSGDSLGKQKAFHSRTLNINISHLLIQTHQTLCTTCNLQHGVCHRVAV